jgi:phenylacetate-CoA ligase
MKLLQLYHILPYPARCAVASVHGARLRRLRYGPETEREAEAALERDYWSAAQWAAHESEALGRMLRHAATNVPWYEAHWAERRRRGDRASHEYLENWPILEKQTLRAEPARFIAHSAARQRLVTDTTSGTTGTPLTIVAGRTAVRRWYGLQEARVRRWNGVDRHDRWAILGGQLVTPRAQRQPPCWIWNAGLNQLYMSSYHLSDDLIPHYLDAIGSYRVRYLLGYTSALVALAAVAVRTGWQPPRLEVVLTNAEPLWRHQRALLEQAFGCPVRETYGMSEMVGGASECASGALHAWPDVAQMELIGADGRPVADGSPGELLCTTLLNTEMPLIRYRIGDRATSTKQTAPCPCGRTLPRLQSVDGRSDDVLFTADGRQVGRLDPVFKGCSGIGEAQIIQETLQRVRVRFVPLDTASPADTATLTAGLRERLGNVEVVLEQVPSIERTPAGKFRAVICQLDDHAREELALR